MREIRFRAWDDDLKEMMVPTDLSQNSKYWDGWLGNKDLPLMQFTGFRDKKGVEIYEGDLIDNIQADANEVFWYDEDGSWCMSNHHATALPLSSYASKSEVIGNIYEHGYLLGPES